MLYFTKPFHGAGKSFFFHLFIIYSTTRDRVPAIGLTLSENGAPAMSKKGTISVLVTLTIYLGREYKIKQDKGIEKDKRWLCLIVRRYTHILWLIMIKFLLCTWESGQDAPDIYKMTSRLGSRCPGPRNLSGSGKNKEKWVFHNPWLRLFIPNVSLWPISQKQRHSF